MHDPPAPTPSVRRLVDDLLDGAEPDPPVADLAAWLGSAPRFRAFVEANRGKVRKKLRGTTTPGARLDLRAELRVASLLLADRRIELAFEAYGSGNRGPDFTAVHRAGRPFNVEVTRRQAANPDASLAPAILGKLRQLPPAASNVLVIAVDTAGAPPDPGPVVRELRARADRRDDAFFAARGVDGAAAFHAGLLRLSVVLAWADPGPGAEPAVTSWANAGARIPLPAATLRALVAALSGGDPRHR